MYKIYEGEIETQNREKAQKMQKDKKIVAQKNRYKIQTCLNLHRIK